MCTEGKAEYYNLAEEVLKIILAYFLVSSCVTSRAITLIDVSVILLLFKLMFTENIIIFFVIDQTDANHPAMAGSQPL